LLRTAKDEGWRRLERIPQTAPQSLQREHSAYAEVGSTSLHMVMQIIDQQVWERFYWQLES